MSIDLKAFPSKIYRFSFVESYKNCPSKSAVPKLTTPFVSGAPANLVTELSASLPPVTASFAIRAVSIVPDVSFAALMSGISEADRVAPAVM